MVNIKRSELRRLAVQHLGNDSLENQQRIAVMIATSHAARVSYTTVGDEGKAANYENDIKLHDRLAASGHWSPFEHCAKAMSELEYQEIYVSGKGQLRHSDYANSYVSHRENQGWCGNFRGFMQYRKMFSNENII